MALVKVWDDAGVIAQIREAPANGTIIVFSVNTPGSGGNNMHASLDWGGSPAPSGSAPMTINMLVGIMAR